MSKKNRFEIGTLVKEGLLKEGQELEFISEPQIQCKVVKHGKSEYKLAVGAKVLTLHQFVTECLKTDPPDHASKWVRVRGGKILAEIWSEYESADEAA